MGVLVVVVVVEVKCGGEYGGGGEAGGGENVVSSSKGGSGGVSSDPIFSDKKSTLGEARTQWEVKRNNSFNIKASLAYSSAYRHHIK